MPLNHRTPESLLGRSDSKNPSTTCRGITTNGRACRRSLASPKSSPAAPYRGQIKDGTGIVAIIQDDAGGLTDAAFYCWQHREQASNLTHQSYPQCTHSTLLPVQERTSIDSLVARLGVMAIDQGRGQQQKKLPPRSDQRRPAPSVPSDMHDPFVMPKGNSRRQPATDQHQQRNRPSFWASLCCMTQPDDEDDYFEVVHHKKRTNQYDGSQSPMGRPYPVADTPTRSAARTGQRPSQISRNAGKRRSCNNIIASATSIRAPLSELPVQPANQRLFQSPSETQSLLALIPSHLSPQTASVLLSELSKPISPYDEEGYIYIFWLTESSTSTPPSTTAASLLHPPTPTHSRRLSDVLSEYSSSPLPSTTHQQKPRTIMLKIGRANNVHRRMNEWTRQCGYNLSLVRWYPYVSSSPKPSPASSPTRRQPPGAAGLYPDLSQAQQQCPDSSSDGQQQVRKVPIAHRVERLVHLELADQRVKRNCAACGKEHREWFEIEASEAGVKAVDEVVKRWVRWAEQAQQRR